MGKDFSEEAEINIFTILEKRGVQVVHIEQRLFERIEITTYELSLENLVLWVY